MNNKSILTLLLCLTGLVALLNTVRSGQADEPPPEDPLAGTLFDRSDELRQFAEQTGFVPSNDQQAQDSPVPGDLDGDGQVDGNDFAIFVLCLTDQSGEASDACTDQQKAAADFNADGAVDIKDYRRLLKHEHDASQ